MANDGISKSLITTFDLKKRMEWRQENKKTAQVTTLRILMNND